MLGGWPAVMGIVMVGGGVLAHDLHVGLAWRLAARLVCLLGTLPARRLNLAGVVSLPRARNQEQDTSALLLRHVWHFFGAQKRPKTCQNTDKGSQNQTDPIRALGR